MADTAPVAGQIVRFMKYADPAFAENPIFQAGQFVLLKEEVDGGGWQCEPLTGDKGDTLFPEEFQIVPAAEARAAAIAAGRLDLVADATMEERNAAEAGPAEAPQTEAAEAAPAAQEAAPAAEGGKGKGGKGKGAGKGQKGKTAPAVIADVPAAPPVQAEAAPEAAAEGEAIATEEPAAEAAPAAEGAAPRRILVVARSDGQGDLHIDDTDAVADLLAGQDALAAAKSLVRRQDETYFTLGGVLAHIYSEGLHKSAGYEGKRGFGDYVQKELGVDYRKAMYLIDIYTAFRPLGMDEKRLAEIGWSKAKELTKVVNVENVDGLMEFAKGNSRDDLISHVKSTFADTTNPDGSQTQRKTFKIVAFGDQSETIQRALDVAKQQAGTDDLAQAMERICGEWLQTAEGVDVPLEDAIHFLQQKYGVTLARVDAGDAVAAEGEAQAEATQAAE